MPRLVAAPCSLAALALLLGLAVVQAGKLIRPDEFLRLKLKYTLENNALSPPNRCIPEPEAVAAARSSNAECNLLYGSAPYDGECHPLLGRGPCPAHHWIVLDKNTERTTCQFQVCPNHQVLMAGGCTRLGVAASAKHCKTTLQLIINEYGEAECECPMGRVYYPRTEQCYELFEQGPCEDGRTLQVTQTSGGIVADCLPSLCPSAGQVPMTPRCELAESSAGTPSNGSYKCYNLSSTGPCTDGFLTLDRTMFNVGCFYNKPHGLYDSLPGGPPCTPGSKRDSMRPCARDLQSVVAYAVTKSPPTIKPRYDSEGDICPDGYVFVAGTCLHTQSGI